ncbi:DUF4974 domain-containing protein [Sphingobacterium sp. SGG-5]|uniref:FecR family protein n=1 Tax=Sphingobacterium sp. SGG-5 TaxID=2710881 RepID=UPI0013EBF787|nr:FecR family protein [Sphingobacterium sp. SGG-5]NGM62636.1 DUF4974 domain-containing protein [Sphingobacterium sp. SGG-5]
MDTHHIRAAELVARYLQGEITSKEAEELISLMEKYPSLRSWVEDKEASLEKIGKRMSDYESIDPEKDWQLIWDRYDRKPMQERRFNKWWVVAASIIAICVVGGSLFWKERSGLPKAEAQLAMEVTPGKEVATLVLSDGSTVELGDNSPQTITDGALQLAASGSMLDYSEVKNTQPQIHKLQVPLGGTFQIQLSDGTKVWLNADSELEFPSTFVGDERKVKVRGEAYFEVAKDPSKPFRVEVNDTQVEALGTAFNINTHLYRGTTKTILTEGKIKVSSGGESKVIEPGYGTISGQGNIQVGKADIEEALAWKDGYFYFDSKNLREVLEEVARWYNVEVDMRNTLANQKYRGGIKKSESIQAVCAVLSDLTAYHVSIERKKIVVK